MTPKQPRFYAEAGTPNYARIEPGGLIVILGQLRGERYELAPADHRLHMAEPFPFDLDLTVLMSADRPG